MGNNIPASHRLAYYPFLVNVPKEKSLLENFNLTLSDWQKIFDYQKGLCAICQKPLIKPNTDHEHASGLIRGILCIWCNRNLREYMTVDFVQKVLNYLTNPPASTALGRPHYGLPGRVGTKTRRKLIKKLKKESNAKSSSSFGTTFVRSISESSDSGAKS